MVRLVIHGYRYVITGRFRRLSNIQHSLAGGLFFFFLLGRFLDVVHLDPFFPVRRRNPRFAVYGAASGGFRDYQRPFVAHKGFKVSVGAVGGYCLIKRPDGSLFGFILINGHNVVIPVVSFPVVDTAAGHYGFGICAEEPAIDVYLVRAEVNYRAASESLIPAPVSKLLHRVKTVLFQCGLVNNGVFRET